MSKRKTTEEFIKESKEIHGDKYDYSKTNYINANTKVCIICPIHGEFWQKPVAHTKGKHKCPQCSPVKKLTQEEFIKKAKKVHGDKYDYSKVLYKNIGTKVCIICPIHGEFWQDPHNHLKGVNCPECGKKIQTDKKRLSQEEVIKKAKKVHGNKYDYSKVKYKAIGEKICIICPKHGEFWQDAHSHLKGSGCPKCKNSTLENKILIFLEKHNIKYVYQYFPEFLKNGRSKQSLDFYLPKYNIAIECQGKQHYTPVKVFGGKESFIKQVKMDKIKYDKCLKNGITILYFSQCKEKDKNAISSLKVLLNEITKNIK